MASNLKTFITNLKAGKGMSKYAFTKTSEFEVAMFFNGYGGVNNFSQIVHEHNHLGIPTTISKDIDATLAMDINYYVNTVDLANLVHGGKIIELSKAYGETNPGITDTVLANSMVIPQETELKMSLFDTQISFIDSLIVPWMYINGSPTSTLPNLPNLKSYNLTLTADIFVYLYVMSGKEHKKNVFRTYVFRKCKPVAITTPNVTHEEAKINMRDVHFAFSNMEIILPSHVDAQPEAPQADDQKIDAFRETI